MRITSKYDTLKEGHVCEKRLVGPNMVCLEAIMELFEDDAAADCADNIARNPRYNQGFLARKAVPRPAYLHGSGVQNGPEGRAEDRRENDHVKPIAASGRLSDAVLV